MRSSSKKFRSQFQEVVKFCQESDFDKMIQWIEDQIESPTSNESLYRVSSQNRDGNKFISKKIIAKTKSDAALFHSRIWPEYIITHIEQIY